MNALPTPLRNQLAAAIKEARRVGEVGARRALEGLAVGRGRPFDSMTEGERRLRNRLRAHGRQLGDRLDRRTGEQAIDHLVHAVAYEQWHRMLFARFLAENHLLIEPDSGVAISMAECEELAREQGVDPWDLAGRFAATMLPRIFRPDDPALALPLAPESRQALEGLVADLPAELFTADDALGWTYQFWQAERKAEVNASGVKIGADELPAVTQLFTEHYMVLFLFHNTIGAWHAGKVLAARPELAEQAQSEVELRRAVRLTAAGGCSFDYLRFVKVEAASRRVTSDSKRRDAASTLGYFHQDEPVANLSGNLPHWRQEGVTYFVTFRTADSLPQEKLQAWRQERDVWLAEHPEPHDEATCREYHERFSDRLQQWLDAGYGECVLELPEVQAIVEGALRHFDGVRYHLDEFVVMPNHVHILVTPIGDHTLSKIVHSWKSYTAHEVLKVEAASRRLTNAAQHQGRNHPRLWQKESFDHIVRSPQHLERIRQYIRENPVNVDAASRRVTDDSKRRDAASTLWRPAAGTFDGWPKRAQELRVLDPCCGSGHFLVVGFKLLVRLRMEEEGLDLEAAIRAVLAENLFGLEIDPRCTQIAAFNLALAAWRLAGRPMELPPLNLACSGLAPNTTREAWLRLAEEAAAAGGMAVKRDLFDREETLLSARLEEGLSALYDLFQQAPELGSLIDPRALGPDLFQADFDAVHALLGAALEGERDGDEQTERAVAAQGMARAAELLAGEYTLVITNVPYLARGKQSERLKTFADRHHPEAKNDLATIFISRGLAWLGASGTSALVTPQNWLFLTSYKKLRERLLTERTWNLVARLGTNAFETIGGHVVNVALPVISGGRPDDGGQMAGLDVSNGESPNDKAVLLVDAASRRVKRPEAASTLGDLKGDVRLVPQAEQARNPDARVTLHRASTLNLLESFANCRLGLGTGDAPHYIRKYWEFASRSRYWASFQNTVGREGQLGYDSVVAWDYDIQRVYGMSDAERVQAHNQDYRGREVWGKPGVSVSIMSTLRVCMYSGERFDKLVATLVPKEADNLTALATFVGSAEFVDEVRKLDQKLMVTNATLVKVPFDLPHWQKVAEERYPNGLPEPYSDDPTQWIFHGHPCGSVVWDEARKWTAEGPMRVDGTVLQVAVARLLGYRWPAELDGEMRLAAEQRAWVARCQELERFADEDGIVCLSALRGERPAADRLRQLLAAAYGAAWSGGRERELLLAAAEGGRPAPSLEVWLRDRFFEGHCKLFHHRPFIWHLWDGRKDGFHCLVNAHRLTGPDGEGRRTLEALTYSYLGDWIERQRAAQRDGEEGADGRLAAALDLQGQLERILEGEPPCDLFIRWKPLHEQPLGWDPDINDGVRLNIRPFMSAELRKGGRKGAGLLRWKPNIKWKKDRGKEPKSLRPKADYPWFWSCPGDGTPEERTDFKGGDEFDGQRWNDLHYTRAVKVDAASRRVPEDERRLEAASTLLNQEGD